MKRLAAIVLLLGASEALGHAELVSSTPAHGAALAAAPARIELRFNEPVRPLVLRLVDRDGRPIALAPAEAVGESISLHLPARLSDGLYTLSFRVTSLDSHPVGGSIVFGVGMAPAPPASAALEQEPIVFVMRFVRDLALVIAAGAALFVLVFGAFKHHRALLVGTALAGAAACVLAIPMHGAALMGEGGMAAWGTGLHSSFGASGCVALAGLLAIATLQRRAMIAGALLAAASLPLTGHALVAEPRWLAMPALFAHGLAAAFWAGSLAGLVFVLRAEPLRAAAALRGFSPLGMAAVALLAASGVALAWLQLQEPADVVASRYGRFILLKSGLLSLLIVLALVNRYRLLAALERGHPRARRIFVGTISAELGLISAVMAVTALLVHTPPDRAQAQDLESGGRSAELSVAPARVGANAITVRMSGAQEVSIELANPTAGVEPMLLPTRRVAADHYRYDGAALAIAGSWDLTVHARVSDFETIPFATKVTIR